MLREIFKTAIRIINYVMCDVMVIPCMVVLVTSATNTKADGHQRN